VNFVRTFAVIAAVSIGLSACSGDDGPGPDDEEAPTLATATVASAPEPPAGLDVVCMTDGSATLESSTCPVLIWNGITYWAFSYEDGRNSMVVVGYNSNNEVVKQLSERTGAKNLWQITINQGQSTVTLRGQADATIVIPWSELLP
jgi:hypothetical protein